MPFTRLKAHALWLLVAALLGLTAPAGAAPIWNGQLFPVEEVVPGLRGTGYTVIGGTDIEAFDVLFLGVLPGAGPAGDLLLVETSGPLIEQTGGIASGMSGSPVFVDGRLVGAIAYGFGYADHRIGLVTPIGDMLRVLERMGAEDAAAQAPSPAGPRQVAFAPDEATAAQLLAQLPPGTEVLVPLATPLMAGGFGPRALHLVEGWAKRLLGGPFLTVPTGTAPASVQPGTVSFQPGSAFGVQLLGGDVSLSALGTVTWTDGDRFLGLGHPFLNGGAVHWVTSGAAILRTVSSAQMPFKVGVVTDPAGTLTQDRAAGVAGRLGPLPERVQVAVRVTDLDHPQGETPQRFSFWAVDDPWLLPDLVTVGVLQALDQGIDRIGPGTARVLFRLEAESLPQTLVRDNMVYSESDVSALAVGELLEGVELLAANPFREVPLRRVEVEARITRQPQVAQIVEVRPAATRGAAGDSVLIEVELQTYRGPRETRAIRLTIPPGTPAGRVAVTVRGGYSTSPSAVVHAELFAEEKTGEPVEEGLPLPEGGSLEEQLETFRTRERNYELVAEFYPPFGPLPPAESQAGAENPARTEGEGAPMAEEDRDQPRSHQPSLPGNGKPVQARLATDWVIRGSDQFELEIVEPVQEEEPVAEAPGSTPF